MSVIKEKFIALNGYIRKEERLKINVRIDLKKCEGGAEKRTVKKQFKIKADNNDTKKTN